MRATSSLVAGARPGVLAHHIGAHREVADVPADVHGGGLTGQGVGVLRPLLPRPGHLAAERLEREVLEEAEQIDDLVALRAGERGDGVAAVAEHHRRVAV